MSSVYLQHFHIADVSHDFSAKRVHNHKNCRPFVFRKLVDISVYYCSSFPLLGSAIVSSGYDNIVLASVIADIEERDDENIRHARKNIVFGIDWWFG